MRSSDFMRDLDDDPRFQRHLNRVQYRFLDRDSEPRQLAHGQMQTGHVQWFHKSTGQGQIIDSQGNKLFSFFLDINRPGWKDLHDGEPVRFRVEMTGQGPIARDITPLNDKTV